jgi:hypothetical protein
MASEAVLASLEAAAGCIGRLGLSYALVGGAALPAWGRIHATQDADLLIHLASGQRPVDETLADLVDSMRKAGFAHLDRADRRRVEDKSILFFWFPVRPQGFSVRLDLIVVDAPRYREVIDRAVIRKVNGFAARVASCEDLILLKLAASRAVDVADARELLEINCQGIDRPYLEGQAASFGVEKELRQLFDSEEGRT